MQKKSKTILTAVVTALFVLSVGYFALLAPTTAWFYQKDDKIYDFTFGDFNMSETLQSAQIADVTLRGTTRFADAGEMLFDEMVHVVHIQATNSGTTAGSVRVKVNQWDDNENAYVELPVDNNTGLKWFVYAPSDLQTLVSPGNAAANTLKIVNNHDKQVKLVLTLNMNSTGTVSNNGTSWNLTAGENKAAFTVNSGSLYTVSNLPDNVEYKLEYDSPEGGVISKGAVPPEGRNVDVRSTAKTAINTMLRAWNSTWPIDYNSLTHGMVNDVDTTFTDYNLVDGQAELAYEAYNTKAIEALKEYNKGGVTVMPGDSNKDIYVVFWAEYGDLKDTFGVGDTAENRDIETVTYTGLSIDIIAAPDIGGTQTTTLELTNNASSAADLKLYRWTTDAWTQYSDSTATDSNGVIRITAGGTKQIADLPVGARYKLEIQVADGDTQSAFFAANDAFRDMSDDGKSITGTLSNAATNTVTLQSTPSLGIFNTTSSAASVKLYTWASTNGGEWTEASGSPLSVAANGSTSVALALGADYKLEIQTSSVHFNNSSNSTKIIGRITSGSVSYSIVPNA